MYMCMLYMHVYVYIGVPEQALAEDSLGLDKPDEFSCIRRYSNCLRNGDSIRFRSQFVNMCTLL